MTYMEYLTEFNRWQKTNYLPGNARLLYYSLLGLFNEARWPASIQVDNYRLMSMVDTRTERVAISARDKLVDAGFIKYDKGKKGSPNTYRLAKCTHQKVSEYDSVSDSVSVSENDSECDSVSVSQKCSHIKTKNKTKKKKSPPKSPHGESQTVADQDETGFSNQLQAVFEQWLAYKRERREAYKPTGLQSLVTQIRSAAREYGDRAVTDIITQSMASGYRGIVFDKLGKSNKTVASSYDIDELESMSEFLLPKNM